MKKISILIGTLTRSGAERVTVALAEFFAQNGIICDIVTIGRCKTKEYPVPEKVNRICVDENGNLNYFKRIKLLRNYLTLCGSDVLLVMGTPLCVFAIPACFGRNDIKVIVSERNSPANFRGKKITKIWSRFLMKKADGFVFQTNEARDFYKKKLKGKSEIIPNPLIVSDLPEPYVGEPQKVIVTAGRLQEQKNQKLLISAFNKIVDSFSEYKLVIYGEGSLREELERYTRNLGLEDKVLFPGNVNNLPAKIRDASVFVLPSDFEGMPNVLIEAMAVGLPCIATDCPCGGPRELIEDGKNGFLIPVRDEERLVKVLTAILSNKLNVVQIKKNAILIRERLDIACVATQWLNFIRKFVNSSNS